jgi:quercetin dioxygenase-like cupin family protein
VLSRPTSSRPVLTPHHDAAALLALAPRKALLKAVQPFVRWRDGALTRHEIFGNSNFNLVLTSWAPGAEMTLQDPEHFFRVLKGTLRETTAIPPSLLQQGASCIEQGGCSFLAHGRDAVHQLRADSNTITLHMFSPPLRAPDLAF